MEPLRFRYRRSGWEKESFRLFAKRAEIHAHSVLLDRRKILIPNIIGTAISGNELVISVMTPHGRDDVHIAVASGGSRGATFSSGTRMQRVSNRRSTVCAPAPASNNADKSSPGQRQTVSFVRKHALTVVR